GRAAFDGPVDRVLREHTDALLEMGVWLPATTLAALRLPRSGYELEPLPLTPEELTATLVREGHPIGSATPEEHPHAASRLPTPPDPTPGRPIIRAKRLTVLRERQTILHGIDLEIQAESLTAIVGANGAGKTTLIQALAGVVPPPRRQVEID